MNSSDADISTVFFLDEVSGARIPASRLRTILERVQTQQPLTALQQDFLRQRGHEALLKYALGELGISAFRERAQLEREGRLIAIAAAKSKEAASQTTEMRRRAEVTKRKNAAIFDKQKKDSERRKKARRLCDRFGQPYIEREDFRRVMKILRAVEGGQPIDTNDLVWLGVGEHPYWTDELRKAHHEIMAKNLSEEWRKTGDVWTAINACSHWRKAGVPREGLTIAEKALDQAVKPKMRSALLTTGGGALRDLRRRETTVQFGKEAHSLTPDDFRPCTLLGAVHIELGAYIEGAEWYEKAEARGASRKSIDCELQSILNAAAPDERNRVKIALKTRNATRYGWL